MSNIVKFPGKSRKPVVTLVDEWQEKADLDRRFTFGTAAALLDEFSTGEIDYRTPKEADDAMFKLRQVVEIIAPFAPPPEPIFSVLAQLRDREP